MEKKPDLVLSFLCFGVAFQCRELDEIQARVGRYMKFDQTQSDFVRYQTDRSGCYKICFAGDLCLLYLLQVASTISGAEQVNQAHKHSTVS